MWKGPNLSIAVRLLKNWGQGARRPPRILDRWTKLDSLTFLAPHPPWTHFTYRVDSFNRKIADLFGPSPA